MPTENALLIQESYLIILIFETEYNHAYQSAIMAHKWEAMDTEYLEYSTVGDSNVRPEHQALDKFTAQNRPCVA